MEMPSKLVLTIIAEALFLIAVALSVAVAYQHKKYKRTKKNVDTLEHILDDLRSHIVRDQNSLKNSENQEIPSSKVEEELEQAQKLLITYKQRLENLERFRTLYFELDDRLSNEIDQSQHREKQIEELKLLIERQEIVIQELKSTIHKISQEYQLSEETCHSLEKLLEELEENSNKLHEQLNIAEAAVAHNKQLESELEHYKNRVEQLEEVEHKLSKKSEQYRKQLEETQEYSKKKNPYGKVKISEIENMSKELSVKEKEIHHLRQECDTIAKQYETLATTSLKSIEEMQKASNEERINLEQMQCILEQAAKNLEEKQKECETLESLYLELKYSDSDVTESLLDQSILACDELKSTIMGVATKADSLNGGEENKTLSKVKERLEERERALAEKRKQFRHLKGDYKNMLDQNSEVANSIKSIELENLKLRSQIEHMEHFKAEVKSKDVEINTLRKELNVMEDRYLKLLEKQRR